ncbi:hypothetical protein ACFQZ4_24235 [Catellatospora coxensis]|uniref:Uncharacterized protein n=1 Tax=Catellatospora coxensis TaxID=310354 RepID=A0A8J3L6T2_9ACTN|nr:hypothetical protein [Catellatospora coxensis]GIG10224.1 hypothetical protein Cco03nite_69240 [Catellatospora coxensis]
MDLAMAAVGLVLGLAVGYGLGRRTERASLAWEATRASFIVARGLTGQALGYALGAALLLACAGLALWVAR